MRNKKNLIALLCMGLALSSSVCAKPLCEDTIDYNSGKVVLSGKTDKLTKPITVQVFKAEKSLSDFEGDITAASDYVVFVGQTLSDETGNFEFTFEYAGDSNYEDASEVEKLNIQLTYEGAQAVQGGVIEYVDNGKFEDVIAKLNAAAQTDDLQEFKNIATQYGFILNMDLDLAGTIDIDKALTMLCSNVKTTQLDKADSITVGKRGVNAIVSRAVNEKKLTSILDYIEKMNVDKKLAEYIKFFVKDASAEQRFLSILNSKTIQNDQNLTDALKEAVILTAVRYPQGFMNLKNVCEEYSDLVGISGKNYSNSKYSSIAGSTTINTLPQLKAKLEASSENQGSSGGGGGGGGSTVNVPVIKDTVQAPQTVNMPFDDLASVEWAHTAISTLSDRGIVSGKSNNKYCPNDYITREELVKIIVSATKTELNASGSNFADVTEDAWFAKYVNAAYSNGLCKGIGNGNFGVGINITRQDAATMLYNALVNENAELVKQSDKSFVDSSEISNYAAEAVQKLSEAGIVNGDSNQNFNPKSLLTRAEAAQLVYGYLKYFE